MTSYNIRADFEPAPEPLDLDDAVEALKDLHVSVLEEPDGRRSYTLTLDAVNAWSATETATARLAALGHDRAALTALDVLTTEAFDAREDVGGWRLATPTA